jgi:hypothetical protein
MHVHADIDERYQISPTESIQFVFCSDAVQTTYDDVRPFQDVETFLPLMRTGENARVRIYTSNLPLCDGCLPAVQEHVKPCTADQPVQIASPDPIGIDSYYFANSDMSELLANMGAATAETYHGNTSSVECMTALMSEE